MTTQPQFRAVTERRNLDNTGLDAALAGTVNTGVLVWDAAAFVNNGIVIATAPAGTWPAPLVWATEINSPADGTSVKLLRRGVYLATFSVTVPASGGAAFGISYQTDNPAQVSTPGLLAANTPVNGAAGIRQGVIATAPAATVIPVTLVAEITISDRDAGDAQSGIIRFHGNDGAGAAIQGSDIDEAVARYTIAYVGDSMGS